MARIPFFVSAQGVLYLIAWQIYLEHDIVSQGNWDDLDVVAVSMSLGFFSEFYKLNA